MNLRDVLEPFVFFLGLVYLSTGAAIWLRWGWVGVEHFYRERHKIDAIVRKDAARTARRVEAHQ